MDEPDYDDPKVEQEWCDKQRAVIADYLLKEGVKHGRIGDWPAWHIAPVVSIWAIESQLQPNWIGWWAFSGDLPTDYISSADVTPPQHPRKALAAIAERWLRMAEAWNEDREFDGVRINAPSGHTKLAPMLESSALSHL